MARIDRSKRAFRTAIKRDKPSRAAHLLVQMDRIKGRVLDYGCGYGFDADHFGWEGYDPYYRSVAPVGPYDTITSILVLNVLSRNIRTKALDHIRTLLTEDGHAFLAVVRNIPKTGKLGLHHSLINYVQLTLPSVHLDKKLEIYDMSRSSDFKDKTIEFTSRRDKRRDR